MAQYVVDGDKLTAIADAIRGKTGGTENLTLDQMPTEIEGIETEIPDEYIIPTGSVTITENGTHDVTEKASAVVEVPIPDGYIIPSGSETITANGEYDITEKASVKVEVPEPEISLQNKEITANGTYTADDGYDGLGQVVVNVASSGGDSSSTDEIINNILTRGFTEFSSDATSIGKYAFCECRSLVNIDFPNLTNIGNYAFGYCVALTSVDFPNVTSIGTQSFYACSSLEDVSLPNVTSIPTQAFGNCVALTSVDFPNVTSIGTYAFNSCRSLITADFPLATSIGANAFGYCYKLTALILRSETMCTLANTNAFINCYHILGTTNSNYNPNGDKDGYIYVPSALVDTYKAATNWSTYATQFRALEDYTVDGTTTGALDESKI